MSEEKLEDLNDKDDDEEFFSIQLKHEQYRPGESVEGNVQWKFPEAAETISVRLLLETTANWNSQKIYAAGLQWKQLPASGVCNFSLQLPEGPYSFIGKKIRIDWSVEVECSGWSYTEEAEFTFSPTGEPLELKSAK
jgi:hypothetical protein